MFINNKEQELIDDVMDSLDFQKIASVMEYLNWKWAGKEFPISVKTLKTSVRTRLKSLVIESVSNKEFYMASGGFFYTAFRNKENILKEIHVKFCIEDYEAISYN